MRKLFIHLLMGFFLFSWFGCGEKLALNTVNQLDIDRYLGTWYEIARLPNSFEDGLICCTANYSLREDGKIEVLNRGFKVEKGTFTEAKGSAVQPDPAIPGELKVTFFWPFAGDYYIFHLDADYRYVLIGEPGRKYFWILSRDPKMDDSLYQSLVEIAKKEGFAVDQLIKVPQDCPKN
jgi:apolipoprotein D and lipocalin family protein